MDAVLAQIMVVIKAVLAAMGVPLLVFVMGWAREAIATIKNDRVRKLLGDLVRSVEQQFGAGQGTAKLAAVETKAKALGLTVTRDQIEAAVCDAVGACSPAEVLKATPPTGGH